MLCMAIPLAMTHRCSVLLTSNIKQEGQRFDPTWRLCRQYATLKF